MTQPNAPVADALAELAALLRMRKGERFRVRAYERAARVLRATPVDVSELTESEIRRLEGIGAGIAGVVAEYLQTGSIAMLEHLREAEPPGFGALLRLPLIGVRDARVLARTHGFTGLADLRTAAGAPDGLDTLGERLEVRVRESLRRVDAVASEGLPMPLARREADSIASSLAAIEGVADVLVAGAVRRAVDLVDEFDLVVVGDEPAAVAAALPASRTVVRVLHQTEHRLRVASVAGRPATLWVTRPAARGAALLLATGSTAYVAGLHDRAAVRGYQLRYDGLWRGTTRLAGESEAEILGLLDVPVAPAELREDAAALDSSVPLPVRVADLRGDLHVHSDWSGDGKATIEQMVSAAAARGYAYVAMTDHAENLSINGMSRTAVAARRRTISHLQDRHQQIRILDGAELNIGLDGGIDYDTDFLLQFDITVASIHSHMDRSTRQQTDRILDAIAHPAVHVIGHPSGRIIGHRPPYGIELQAIAQAAAETGTALEVNGSPRRLDLSGEMVRVALAEGATLAVSSDAHSIPELDYVHNAVPTARRGWATPAGVVNCGELDDLLAFVDRKKRRAT
ncbi:MAG: PHP domain-containing protein [Nitriliruptorales bacterium]|nr:PHP domain-containing protein [Nitriliruptorales bacterium]